MANLSCTSTKRLLQTHKDGQKATQMLYQYAKDNLLWLNVYVKDSFATHIVRDERMTRTSFVANVGGLLGLCMGFSLVRGFLFVQSERTKSLFSSTFEIIFHC
jgi:hypothetical protein